VLVLVLLVTVPIVELYVFVQVAGAWGFLNALGVAVLVTVVGIAVVRQQGLRVWRRFEQDLRAGQTPARPIVHGALLLVAGALLIVPGFVTGALGLLLLLPPVRAGIAVLVVRRVGRGVGRVRVIRATYGDPIDVDERPKPGHDDPGSDDRPPRGELNP
jgi:UPF0716 protein FxsA